MEKDIIILSVSWKWKVICALFSAVVAFFLIWICYHIYLDPSQLSGSGWDDPWVWFGLTAFVFSVCAFVWWIRQVLTSRVTLTPYSISIRQGNTENTYLLNNFTSFQKELLDNNGVMIVSYILIATVGKNIRLPGYVEKKDELEKWLIKKFPNK